MTEVLSSSQAGKKKGASGLAVQACINYDTAKNALVLELEIKNETSGPVSEFNMMINKNSFGVVQDAPVSKHNINYPAPFETSPVQYLPLLISGKNADTKVPPACPFELQIAMNSSIDVFYFNVQCNLHNLINYSVPAE